MTLIVDVFQARTDNYGYLAHDSQTGRTAAIDAPEAQAIKTALLHRGWTLSDVFVTHHHKDHVEGIAELKRDFDIVVRGPRAEADRIEGLDVLVEPGETLMLGKTAFEVIFTPGHTLGHVSYFDRAGLHLFTGDALFSLGCGRMFEGTPGPMWEGLLRLRALPDDTLVYCGHEYTQANARYALSIDPDNLDLRLRAEQVNLLRQAGRFTVPSRLGDEKHANPFLRADTPAMAGAMGMPDATPAEVFAAIRRGKDDFKL